MDTPRAKGFSLWLMPEGEERERLAGWIDRLAERVGSERFAPHVTLLAGADGPRAEVLARADAVVARLGPFEVRLDGVDGREEHFLCLFARVLPLEPLLSAHEAAARTFGREPERTYGPHLSLLYGSLPPERKRLLGAEIGPAARLRFEVDRLHVWSTEGPVADWCEVGVLDFALR